MKPAWEKNQSVREGRRVKISTKIGALGGNEGAHSLWIEFTYTYTVVQLRTWPKFDKLHTAMMFVDCLLLQAIWRMFATENNVKAFFIFSFQVLQNNTAGLSGGFAGGFLLGVLPLVNFWNMLEQQIASHLHIHRFFRYCWWQKSSMHGLGYATL